MNLILEPSYWASELNSIFSNNILPYFLVLCVYVCVHSDCEGLDATVHM